MKVAIVIVYNCKDEGKRSLIFAHAVAGDTADSINMLSVGPLYLHLNPKVVCVILIKMDNVLIKYLQNIKEKLFFYTKYSHILVSKFKE